MKRHYARKGKNAMVFVPVPNVVQCNVRYTLFGQLIENVVYVRNEGEFATLSPTEIAPIVGDWAADELIPQLSNEVTLREVYAVALDSDTASVGTWTPEGGPIAGGYAEPSMPGNCAWCVQFRGDGRGRSRRGRNYVPALPTAVVNDNQVTQTWATAVLLAYQALGSTLLENDLRHVIVSRIGDGAPRTAGLVTPVIAYVGIDLTIDSQRRRLTGRGN